MELPHAIDDFAGRWRLARRIDDRLIGREGVFEGVATITDEGARFVYHEAGVLELPPAGPVRAERRYLWQAGEGGVAVLFHDGRFFHAFALGRAGAEARHACPPDDYRVRYDFAAWPRWRAVWEVSGPRKNYRMESLYERFTSPPR